MELDRHAFSRPWDWVAAILTAYNDVVKTRRETCFWQYGELQYEFGANTPGH